MGVINADAFCEICCKEFCNKYFLRTHKLNKHGLGNENSDSKNSQKSGKDENSLNSPKSQVNDDSCLEPGQRDPGSYNGTNFNAFGTINNGNGNELQCDICSRPFSSHYLLRMHKFYSHSIPYIKEEELAARKARESPAKTPEEPRPQSRQETSPSRTETTAAADQASQDLQKLQSMIKELNSSSYLDRATCNLCRTEFENKYFLRVHMMNDHGVIPSEDSQFDSAQFMRNFFDPARLGGFAAGAPTGERPHGMGDSEAFCDICQKEFCSKYFLKVSFRDFQFYELYGRNGKY